MQLLAVVNHVNVTSPVGVPKPEPDTVAESSTIEPNGTDVTPTLWLVTLWIVVAVDVFAFPTVSGSHRPVDAV